MSDHTPAGYGSASALPTAGYGSGGVSEPGDLPRYDTPTGEHPAIIAMRERDAEALAQGYTEGDVNHYVQPLIGHLRLLERDGKPLGVDELAHYVERLHKACNAELAWLQQRQQVWTVAYDGDTPFMDGTHPAIRMAETDRESAERGLEVVRERSKRSPKRNLRIETRFVTEWEVVGDD